MKLVISTQIREWYGDENMVDGRWKNKGGDDYVINIPTQEVLKTENHSEFLLNLVKVVEKEITPDADAWYQEEVLDWSLEEDDYETYYQKLYRENGDVYKIREFSFEDLIK